MNKKINALIIAGIVLTAFGLISQSKDIVPIEPFVYSEKSSYKYGEQITVYAFIFQPRMMDDCYAIDIFDSDDTELYEYGFDCVNEPFVLSPFTLHERTWDQKVAKEKTSNPDEHERIQIEPGRYTLVFFDKKIPITIENDSSQKLQKIDIAKQLESKKHTEKIIKAKGFAIVTANRNTETSIGTVSTFVKDNSNKIILRGTFEANVQNLQSIAIADFNNDGILDVVTSRDSGHDDDKIAVLLGDENGKLGTSTILSIEEIGRGTEARAEALAVDDFNEDGKHDIVSANSISKSISVLLNTTPTNATLLSFEPVREFQVSIAVSPADNPSNIAVADVNNDDHADAITVHQNSDTIKILLGNGDGTFEPRKTFDVSGERSGSTDVAVADFNDDGFLDIVTANRLSKKISVLLHTGTDELYSSDLTSMYNVDQTPISVIVGDFNNDDHIDIVTLNRSMDTNSGTIMLFKNNGNGIFDDYTVFGLGDDSQPTGIAVGNIDGGPLDIVTTNGDSGNISVFIGNGNGFEDAQVFSVGAGNIPSTVAFGNSNSDP